MLRMASKSEDNKPRGLAEQQADCSLVDALAKKNALGMSRECLEPAAQNVRQKEKAGTRHKVQQQRSKSRFARLFRRVFKSKRTPREWREVADGEASQVPMEGKADCVTVDSCTVQSGGSPCRLKVPCPALSSKLEDLPEERSLSSMLRDLQLSDKTKAEPKSKDQQKMQPMSSAANPGNGLRANCLVGELSGSSYQLGKVLGMGFHGSVHHVQRTCDGVFFAVKMPFSASKAAKQELEALCAFKAAGGSPNVIEFVERVKAANQTDFECCYVALELCDMDLRGLMQQHNLPEEVRMELTRQFFCGLSFCHEQGYSHGDLQVTNVLISIGSGVLKLTDFGLAKCCKVCADDACVEEASSGCSSDKVKSVVIGQHYRFFDDLESAARVIIQLWLDRYEFSSVGFGGIQALFAQSARALPVAKGVPVTRISEAICECWGRVEVRFQRFEERMIRWCEENSEAFTPKAWCSEFLTWLTKQPRSCRYSCGMAMPKCLVDNCLILCYPLNKEEPISAAAIVSSLDSVVSEDMRTASAEFFRTCD